MSQRQPPGQFLSRDEVPRAYLCIRRDVQARSCEGEMHTGVADTKGTFYPITNQMDIREEWASCQNNCRRGRGEMRVSLWTDLYFLREAQKPPTERTQEVCEVCEVGRKDTE